MERYNRIRWERLIRLEFPINIVKAVIKKNYGYEIKESSLEQISQNMSMYNDINELELLNHLEKNSYNKLSIFYSRKYKRNKSEPIFEELSNDMLINIFKTDNKINIVNGQYYSGPLGCSFKVTYFNKIDTRFVKIKMSKVINVELNKENSDGSIEEYSEELYDCVKFLIDLDKKIIFMFFSDFIGISNSYEKEVTSKKTALRNLFTDVSKKKSFEV